MRFSICSGNHGNSTSITDTVTWLQRALQECGHRADINTGIEPRAVNILIEHFVDEKALRDLLEGRRLGARYLLIATEPIVGGVFNGGIEDQHWHYGNTDYWRLRFDAFKIAARMAEEIWVLAESMLPAYEQLFPDLPVRFLPHGHVNELACLRQRRRRRARQCRFQQRRQQAAHWQGGLEPVVHAVGDLAPVGQFERAQRPGDQVVRRGAQHEGVQRARQLVGLVQQKAAVLQVEVHARDRGNAVARGQAQRQADLGARQVVLPKVFGRGLVVHHHDVPALSLIHI